MIGEKTFMDSKPWIAVLSLTVAIASAVVSWLSFRSSRRALAISERQEKRHEPSLGIYYAHGYRQVVPQRQLFGFFVSVSNPTDIDNSIVRAEIQITCLLQGGAKTILKLEHNPAVGQGTGTHGAGTAHVFSLPARIDAHQTLSGWLLYAVDNEVIREGTIDSHRLILEDTHGLSTSTDPIMARAWTDEIQKG